MYDDDEGDEEDVTQSRVAEKGGTGLTSHLHSTQSVSPAFLDTFPILTTNDISLTLLGVKDESLT